LFPSSGFPAYSNEDLFQRDALLDARSRRGRSPRQPRPGTLILAGLPLRVGDRLFNCAVALQRARVLGVVPSLPAELPRVLREAAKFARGAAGTSSSSTRAAARRADAPFGSRLLCCATSKVVCVEVCEDLGYRCRRAVRRAQAPRLRESVGGDITVSKADYRRLIAHRQSKRSACTLPPRAGPGEVDHGSRVGRSPGLRTANVSPVETFPLKRA
jgi:NAD+ synthase (glutamine-hydrolysing)